MVKVAKDTYDKKLKQKLWILDTKFYQGYNTLSFTNITFFSEKKRRKISTINIHIHFMKLQNGQLLKCEKKNKYSNEI